MLLVILSSVEIPLVCKLFCVVGTNADPENVLISTIPALLIGVAAVGEGTFGMIKLFFCIDVNSFLVQSSSEIIFNFDCSFFRCVPFDKILSLCSSTTFGVDCTKLILCGCNSFFGKIGESGVFNNPLKCDTLLDN